MEINSVHKLNLEDTKEKSLTNLLYGQFKVDNS